MRNKFNFYLIALLAWLIITPGFIIAYEEEDIPPAYTINNAFEKGWGKIISIYETAAAQRLTFENDEQVTIVTIGLTWSPREKTHIPSIKQVIKLIKTNNIETTNTIVSKSPPK